MAFEDFTAWDENDPSAELSVASNTITVTSEDSNGACVDKNYGASYFAGEFTHYVDIEVSSYSGTPVAGVWAISNIDDWTYADLGSGGLCIYYYPSSGRIYIEKNGSYSTVTGLSTGTRYYLKIVRNVSNNVVCSVYSDSSHTSLIGSTGAVNYTESSDYISVAWNNYNGTWTGYVYNLDIGAEEPATSIPILMSLYRMIRGNNG